MGRQESRKGTEKEVQKIKPDIPTDIPEDPETIRALMNWAAQYTAYLRGTVAANVFDPILRRPSSLILYTEEAPDQESIRQLEEFRTRLKEKLLDVKRGKVTDPYEKSPASGVRPIQLDGDREEDDFVILSEDLEEIA
ncbi:MAG: hypothetical protein OEY44_01705 [Candidatus Peregrinibacteria bacterium]|nr:hypothetical protein [Candidatus Peregrinibacteria bacterium]